MTVRELIEELENFDGDMEVRIGMIQNYGSNFAMSICDNIEEHEIKSFYGEDYYIVGTKNIDLERLRVRIR